MYAIVLLKIQLIFWTTSMEKSVSSFWLNGCNICLLGYILLLFVYNWRNTTFGTLIYKQVGLTVLQFIICLI